MRIVPEIPETQSEHLLVVVAHPDDESLWIGGTLLRLRDAGVALTIICATGADNSIRHAEFKAACAILGAKPVMLANADGWDYRLSDFGGDLDQIVRSVIIPITCIITHAYHGNEHKHPQHKCCYRIARRWSRRRKIPFGIFSEIPLPHHPVARYFENSETISGGTLGGAVNRHKGAKIELFRSMWRARRKAFTRGLRAGFGYGFPDARASLAITVDILRKNALCDVYTSQKAGLREYETINNSREYIYLDDVRAARRLAAVLKDL